MSVKIYMSVSGELVGKVESFDCTRYENACTNEEGHVYAEDVLDEEEISRLGITGDTRIYAVVA
jgi:hypothetical protein